MTQGGGSKHVAVYRNKNCVFLINSVVLTVLIITIILLSEVTKRGVLCLQNGRQ
jgi:hypothetical protein